MADEQQVTSSSSTALTSTTTNISSTSISTNSSYTHTTATVLNVVPNSIASYHRPESLEPTLRTGPHVQAAPSLETAATAYPGTTSSGWQGDGDEEYDLNISESEFDRFSDIEEVEEDSRPLEQEGAGSSTRAGDNDDLIEDYDFDDFIDDEQLLELATDDEDEVPLTIQAAEHQKEAVVLLTNGLCSSVAKEEFDPRAGVAKKEGSVLDYEGDDITPLQPVSVVGEPEYWRDHTVAYVKVV